MKYKEYSGEIWDRIHRSLNDVLRQDPHPVAAFDADGTLWDTDLGEAFFQYEIDRKLVPLPPEAWNHYQELKKKNNDPREAYLWLAQINKDVPLKQVRVWAHQAVQSQHPVPVFSEQKKLIDLLQQKGVEVFIVTASIKWAVEPGAELLGLDFDHVIGIETEVENDLVSERQKGLITYRQGKVDALLERTHGKKPFLTCGNTMGDFHLLESATHAALAVSAAAREDALFKTEAELQEKARQQGWLSHRFI